MGLSWSHHCSLGRRCVSSIIAGIRSRGVLYISPPISPITTLPSSASFFSRPEVEVEAGVEVEGPSEDDEAADEGDAASLATGTAAAEVDVDGVEVAVEAVDSVEEGLASPSKYCSRYLMAKLAILIARIRSSGLGSPPCCRWPRTVVRVSNAPSPLKNKLDLRD